MKLNACFRLMRFHKPVGIVLLWLPTAWALWIANKGMPELHLIIYFLLGTILMRAAGCIINDIADRDIDKHVHRTNMRPLTTGEVGLFQAMSLLFVVLMAALFVLIHLPIECFYYAIPALLVTVLYPFCKRFLQAPQLVLGVAFSMGIPMAYIASGVAPNLTMMLIFMLNFAWIVAYDTMYAMVDRDDDVLIGVRSTAVLFAQNDCNIILILQMFFHGLWLLLAYTQNYSIVFYGFWLLAAGVLIYQQWLIRMRNNALYMRAFSTNCWYGLLMWLALM